MPTLYRWRLTAGGGCVTAHGIVSGHPKLENGLFIHTSAVTEAVTVDGVLLLTTCSGSVYTLRPESIAPQCREKTEECLRTFQIDGGFVERCVQAHLETAEAAGRTLAPGQLFLEVVGNAVVRALFKAGEEELISVRPTVHAGMFQDSDSVLVTDLEGGRVDFRYFPEKDRLRPYHISDGLTEIVVRNLGTADVVFGQQGTARLCPAGELTVLRAAEHDGEWLFSPDAVNGKCLFKEREDKADDVE